MEIEGVSGGNGGAPSAIVAGGGVAGLAAALGLARAGVEVTVLDAAPAGAAEGAGDGRTVAVLEPGVRFLGRLGAWARVAPEAAPLARLRIVSLGPDGEAEADVTFAARELGLPAFGHNVGTGALRAALAASLRQRPGARLVAGAAVVGVAPGEGGIEVRTEDGRGFAADLLVAADGRESAVRRLAGIGARRRATGQTAIVTRFAHARPHHSTSIELHRRGGPFTTVPLRDPRASALVWVERTEDALALLGLDADAFAAELGRRAAPWLGRVSNVEPRHAFPLANVEAERLVAPRCLLLGEAAHALSPLGAQGLNLSLRDAETLAGLAAEAVAAGGDPGSDGLLDRYAGLRAADVRARVLAVDALGRAVDTGFGPVRRARALGMGLLGALPPARRALMRALMAPVPPSRVPLPPLPGGTWAGA